MRYRTVARPALLYSMETIPLTKVRELELQLAELKMLRFPLGVTRRAMIRNEYIRGTTPIRWFADNARKAMLKWFGHA